MTDKKSFAARLNRALDELPAGSRPPAKGQGRQVFVAKMFHVSQKGARKWLEGEALPQTTRLALIARRCGVNGEWLLTGQGRMRNEAAGADSRRTRHEAIAEVPPHYGTSSPRTQRLVMLLTAADNDGRLSDEDVAALEGIAVRLAQRR